jgi:hypothetical protein
MNRVTEDPRRARARQDRVVLVTVLCRSSRKRQVPALQRGD